MTDLYKVWIEEKVLTKKVNLEELLVLTGITGVLFEFECWLVENTYIVKRRNDYES